MKKYLSVFEMITRSSIYKVLGVLIAMVCAEVITCAISWQQPLAFMKPTIEEWVDQSYLLVIFIVAYFLMNAVLVLHGTNIGSIQAYTLQRLRIPEKSVYRLQCLYNILCLGLLWVTQLAVLLGISAFYMQYKANVVKTNMTVFLAFYRNEFMHSILPLQDVGGWAMLVFFIVSTGIFAARFTKSQRGGKLDWTLVVFLAAFCMFFPKGLGEPPIFVIVTLIIWSVFGMGKKVMSKEVSEDEKK